MRAKNTERRSLQHGGGKRKRKGREAFRKGNRASMQAGFEKLSSRAQQPQ